MSSVYKIVRNFLQKISYSSKQSNRTKLIINKQDNFQSLHFNIAKINDHYVVYDSAFSIYLKFTEENMLFNTDLNILGNVIEIGQHDIEVEVQEKYFLMDFIPFIIVKNYKLSFNQDTINPNKPIPPLITSDESKQNRAGNHKLRKGLDVIKDRICWVGSKIVIRDDQNNLEPSVIDRKQIEPKLEENKENLACQLNQIKETSHSDVSIHPQISYIDMVKLLEKNKMLSHIIEKENCNKNIINNYEKGKEKYSKSKDTNSNIIENILSDTYHNNKFEQKNVDKSETNHKNILEKGKRENTNSNEELRSLVKSIDFKKLIPLKPNQNTDNQPQKNNFEKKEEIKNFDLKENSSERLNHSSDKLKTPKFEDKHKNKESIIKDHTNIINEEYTKENLKDEHIISKLNNNVKLNIENHLNPSNEITKKTRFKSKIINFTLKILNRSLTNSDKYH